MAAAPLPRKPRIAERRRASQIPRRQNHESVPDVAEPYARYLRLPGIGGVRGRTFLSCLGVVRFFDLRSVKLPNRSLRVESSPIELNGRDQLQSVETNELRASPGVPLRRLLIIRARLYQKPLSG